MSVTMKKALAALICGALFGSGLAVSGMTDPFKVQGFLDITGNWQPALMWVMGGAVLVTLLSFPFVLRRARPLCAEAFDLPVKKQADRRLLAGSVLFGIGWGLSGYCPGPALVTAVINPSEALWFIPAMLAGFWAAGKVPAACKVS